MEKTSSCESMKSGRRRRPRALVAGRAGSSFRWVAAEDKGPA